MRGLLSPRCAAILLGGLAVGLSGGLGGCEAVQGSGPWMNDASSRTTPALPFDVIDLTPITVVAYRAEPGPRSGNAAARPPSGHVVIQPGDTVQVRIFQRDPGGIFPTIQNPDIQFASQRVDERGEIDVLFVGKVRVAGLDPHQAEAEIARRLEARAKEPLVSVQFVGGRTDSIMVSGEVKSPGRQSLIEGTRSVVDAINRAGGPAVVVPPRPAVNDTLVRTSLPTGSAQLPDDEQLKPPAPTPAMQLEVVVRRRGSVILDKPLADLEAGGDIGVEDGDEIVVRPHSQVITVLGAVQKAANVPMTKSDISLAEVMGQALGLLDDRANRSGLFVFRLEDVRRNPEARGRVFHLDLNQPQSMLIAQQFAMHPADVIFVTNAPVSEYYKIITPLYRTLAIYPIATGSATIPVTF